MTSNEFDRPHHNFTGTVLMLGKQPRLSPLVGEIARVSPGGNVVGESPDGMTCCGMFIFPRVIRTAGYITDDQLHRIRAAVRASVALQIVVIASDNRDWPYVHRQ